MSTPALSASMLRARPHFLLVRACNNLSSFLYLSLSDCEQVCTPSSPIRERGRKRYREREGERGSERESEKERERERERKREM